MDKVSVLYTHFINTINQNPVVQTLLADQPFRFGERRTAGEGCRARTSIRMVGYVFEPTPKVVLDACCPITFNIRFSR